MNEIIIEAIENRKLLEFSYKNHYRIVEPHTYGVSSKGMTIRKLTPILLTCS